MAILKPYQKAYVPYVLKRRWEYVFPFQSKKHLIDIEFFNTQLIFISGN